MPTYGGKDSKGKIITVKPYDLEGDDKLLWLTERQRGLLLAMTEYLDWKSRWDKLPPPLDDDDVRDSYVAELKNRLMMIVEFCAEMIDCISNDEDTINAFNTYLINQFYGNTIIQQAVNYAAHTGIGGENPTPHGNGNLLEVSPACDTDALNGSLEYLVDWMNANNQDLVERLGAASTPQTRSSVMGEVIPEFSGKVVGGAISAGISFLADAVAENYLAFYTETYKDDLICELKCLAEPSCSLSLNTLYGVFSDRIGYTIDVGDTFSNAISFAFFGELTSDKYVDILHFIQIGAFLFMGGFVGFRGLNPLVNALTEGADDPNDDYNDCECAVYMAQVVGVMGSDCGSGIAEEVEFFFGVPFELDAIQLLDETPEHTDTWYLALKLPPGIWEVTVNSIDGTIVESSEPTETAYAWFDVDSFFNNVLWNAPGSPADFGTKVVADNTYPTWCGVQRWHVNLFNTLPFTVNLTVNPAP